MYVSTDPNADNSALINAAIRMLSGSGGGKLYLGADSNFIPVSSPIYMRSGVKLECEGTKFHSGDWVEKDGVRKFIPKCSPVLAAIPECWWRPDSVPGGLSPLCDADGLILGKRDPVGVPAVLRWDDITGYRVPDDGTVSFGCEFRYDGQWGTIASWGGLFLPGEPIEKLRLWVKPDGTIRLDARPGDVSRNCACEGPVIRVGWHSLRADLDTATGEIRLGVNGTTFARKYGSPSPLTLHWSDTLYFGTEAGDWGVQMLYRIASGRVKNAAVRAGGSVWVVASLTDTDGPLVSYRFRYGDSGNPSADLQRTGFLYVPWDTDPIQDWSIRGCEVFNENGSPGLYITNSQNFHVEDVVFRGCGIGVRMDHNVYDGVVERIRVLANVFGIQGVGNGGQSVPIYGSTISLASGGFCGHVANSWHYALIDSFVKDLGPGAVGGLFGHESRGVWTRVNCYNEGGIRQIANVATFGTGNGFSDCTLSRPEATGPVWLVGGKGGYHSGPPLKGSYRVMAGGEEPSIY